DMQWAHGDVGGNGGFNGPSPATVGVDDSSTSGNHVLLGRFNINDGNYDGPQGSIDGVNWLDNRTINLNVSGIQNDAIVLYDQCDEAVQVCLDNSVEVNIPIITLNGNVISDISVISSPEGLDVDTILLGSFAEFQGVFTGSTGNIGSQELILQVTDNQDPPGIDSVYFSFDVQDIQLPPLSISGDSILCDFESSVLTASPGFENYTWNVSGCEGEDCQIVSGGFEGLITVEASYQGCVTSASIEIAEKVDVFEPIEGIPNALCSNDSVLVSMTEFYLDYFESYQWNGNYLDLGGEVYGMDTLSSAYVSPGTFQLQATDTLGCVHNLVFGVNEVPPFISSLDLTNEIIDGDLGSATLEILGGSAPFSISWNQEGCEGLTCDSLVAGNYAVVITDDFGCLEILEFEIEMISSINEIQALNVLIYPNPATDNLQIESSTEISQYKIYSADGQLIAMNLLPSSRSIKLGSLSGGMYSITFLDPNGNVVSRSRFMKL
ncbi:MAG: T9SS type A sorting domain-containing protein, partial [Bacteroidota bacterium]